MKYDFTFSESLLLVDLAKSELEKNNELIDKYQGTSFGKTIVAKRHIVLDLISKLTGIKEDKADEKTVQA